MAATVHGPEGYVTVNTRKTLKHAFPALARRIDELRAEDQDFQELCSDYEDLWDHVEHLSSNQQADATPTVAEHRRLIEDMEQEALLLLTGDASKSADSDLRKEIAKDE